MAEAADIGANFSNYVGNAGAFGGNFGVIAIDTRPLQQLATYTFLANRTLYEQKQKQIEDNAKQVAKITAYDLTNAIPKDRELIQKKYNELYNYVRDNPTVLDYKNNQKGWMEYNKKKNEFENILEGGKVRNLMNLAREEEISKATNVADQKRLREDLDNEINATDINTPLKHTQLFDVKPIAVTAPPSIELDVTKEGANIIASRKYVLPDMASVDAQAQAGSLGFERVSKDPTSSEFKAQSASGKLEPVESAANISQVLMNPKYKDPKFQNPDGTLNLDLVIKDNANNGLVKGVLTSVKQYNEKMREMKNAINNKFFEDSFKQPISFGVGGLDENNYSEIDISDGISTTEILKMRILGMAKPVTYDTKLIQTNDAIQREQLRVQWDNLGVEREKLTKATTQDELAADGILREITDIINIGDKPENQVNVFDERTGKQKTVFKIGDPTILQKFGNVDKDGTTTNVPDEARYNPKTNEIDLVYFKKDVLGEIETTKTGRIIRDIKPLNARTWANMIVQRSGSGKERGEINEIIQSVITKNGGDLYKIAKALDPNTATTTPTKTEPTDLSSLDPNGFKKEGKNYRYKDGTLYDAKGNIVKQK